MVNQLYQETMKARFDVSDLSLDDLLKLDYKKCITNGSSDGGSDGGSDSGGSGGIGKTSSNNTHLLHQPSAIAHSDYSSGLRPVTSSDDSDGSDDSDSSDDSNGSDSSGNTGVNTNMDHPVTCGMSSIMRSYTDICNEYNTTAIEASLQAFATTKSIDIVFGFTATERKKDGTPVKHLIMVCNNASPAFSFSRIVAYHAFLEHVKKIPQSLSSSLKKDPIMKKQDVLANGVLLMDTPLLFHVDSECPIMVLEIQNNISRKALKPIVEEWIESVYNCKRVET